MDLQLYTFVFYEQVLRGSNTSFFTDHHLVRSDSVFRFFKRFQTFPQHYVANMAADEYNDINQIRNVYVAIFAQFRHVGIIPIRPNGDFVAMEKINNLTNRRVLGNIFNKVAVPDIGI